MKLTPKNINASIRNLTASLIEKGICTDSNFPSSRNTRKGVEIAFSGAENISFLIKDIAYLEIYKELKDTRSFNMKFIDGSLLQMMYFFGDDYLLQHRLAFYPSPELPSFQDEADSYMQDELFIDIIQRKIIPFPLRFDFDVRKDIYVEVTHPKSHLTLGDVKDCRIPVSAPLTPYWFVDFILRNFYQTKRYDFIKGLPQDGIKISPSISEMEKNLIHMVIPY